jgi:hypothetical protein
MRPKRQVVAGPCAEGVLPADVTPDHLAAAQRVVEGVPPEVDSAQLIMADHDRGMQQRAYEELSGTRCGCCFKTRSRRKIRRSNSRPNN